MLPEAVNTGALNRQSECNGAIRSCLLELCTQHSAFTVVGFILSVPIPPVHHGVSHTVANTTSWSISSNPVLVPRLLFS